MSTRRQRSRNSIGLSVAPGAGQRVDTIESVPTSRHLLRQHPRVGFAARAQFLRAIREGAAPLFPGVLDPERFAVEAFVAGFLEEFPDAGLAEARRRAEAAFPDVEISPKQIRDIYDDLEGVDRSHGRTRRKGQRGGRHPGRRITYMIGGGLLAGDKVSSDE